MRTWFLLAFGLCMPALAAAETRLVTLKNGEQIFGEVQTDTAGLRVTTPSGKTRRVPLADVESVQSMGGGPALAAPRPSPAAPGLPLAPPAGTPGLPDVTALQQRLMADPEVMTLVLQLAEDPQLMAAAMDPRLHAAIKAGDLAALQRDPNLARVAADPRVRALVDKLMGQVPARP